MSRLPACAAINPTLCSLLSIVPLALSGCGAPAPEVNLSPRPPVASNGPVAAGNEADAALDIDIPLEALHERDSPALVVKRDVFRFGSASSGVPRGFARLPSTSGGTPSESLGPTDGTGASGVSTVPDHGDPMRFIGLVAARDRVGPVAVLADVDGVYHGVAQDVVKGRYRILSIMAGSVELEDLPSGTRLMLRLTGARPAPR